MIRRQALFAFLSLFLALGCGGDYDDGVPAGDGDEDGESDGAGATKAGVLTGALWDDNLNFDIFQSATETFFSAFTSLGNMPTIDRVEIAVVGSDGAALSGALVEVYEGDATYLLAPAGTDGRLSFFPSLDGAANATSLRARVTADDGTTADVSVSGNDWRIQVPTTRVAPVAADIAFIVDATGSMGDEIAFVRAEVESIASRVSRDGLSLRFALVVYRDDGDDYLTRSFDFDDIDSFRDAINAQSAYGGGDYPEALDAGLVAGAELDWRDGNVARLAFLIADAPPHDQNVSAALEAANGYRLAGVRLYPVAASGAADLAEYVMRLGALVTRGRFIFITDDSGVGNPHAEPHIPCYEVEKLGDLMVRVIESELAGELRFPEKESIIREFGNMVEGRCFEPNQLDRERHDAI